MKLEAALAAMDYDEKAALRERFAAELVPIAQLLAARSLGYRNGELQRTGWSAYHKCRRVPARLLFS